MHPIAVNETVVHTYNFRTRSCWNWLMNDKLAPERMFHNVISFANTVNGTGSLVLTNDLETTTS
jgi:hypothetical protein